ncbi:hypothetical protein GUITHDRAFT_135383 [Guillardia theta CCMP2712]|uniref:Uncharacterized protein n=1 Tax=Guillardia theta (strain CCMP2712) TaxID=905079 RepID=L1JP25_GUITC|nr:hypothetical protein GUITHDRAFT_135383 [Guillardia theta CCMP2712]EKX50212.1 hypothetical protein GUITHDRAFT_135383 [Guillardia theta CCMP2712]|eukprot:XP_005837192.1 hypothetical protein GUITHDRAFT_135383 [Guillardia theta CCMP2712]
MPLKVLYGRQRFPALLLLSLSSFMLDVRGKRRESGSNTSVTPLILLVDVYDTTFLVGSKDRCLPACRDGSEGECRKDLGNDDVTRFGLGQRRMFGIVRDNGCPFPHLKSMKESALAQNKISAVIHTDFVLQDDYDECSSAALAQSPFVGGHEVLNYSSALKVAWLVEPRQLSSASYAVASAAREKFDLIFTHMQEYVRADSRKFRFCPFGTTYLRRKLHKMHNKTRRVSIIASRKGYDEGGMEGHRMRHNVIRSFSSRIDGLFASGYEGSERGWQDNKAAGLQDFMFSIVIENVKEDCWFTEKLLDCFLTGTVPIYWGCPSIHEHFDTRGMILLEDVRALDEILGRLSPMLYDELLPFARSNFKTAQRHYLDPLLWMWEREISPLLREVEEGRYRPVSQVRPCNVSLTPAEQEEDALADSADLAESPDLIILLLVDREVSRHFLARTLESILGQSYEGWRCIVAANNASLQDVRHVMEELNVAVDTGGKFTLHVSGKGDREEYSPIYHILYSLETLQDSDVVLLLQGGDWLHGRRSLWEIARAYRGNVWLTYGRAIEYPSGKVQAHVRGMSEEEVKGNRARYIGHWTFGPPYSFKVGLVRGIHTHDLTSNLNRDVLLTSLFDRGKPEHVKLDEMYMQSRVDFKSQRKFVDTFLPPPVWEPALIWPLVEMAGRHVLYLDRIVYVFNVLTRKELHRHSGIFGHPAVKWLQPRDGEILVVEELCQDGGDCSIVMEVETTSLDIPWQGCLRGWLNLFPILEICSAQFHGKISILSLPSGAYNLELQFIPNPDSHLQQREIEDKLTFYVRRAHEPATVMDVFPGTFAFPHCPLPCFAIPLPTFRTF